MRRIFVVSRRLNESSSPRTVQNALMRGFGAALSLALILFGMGTASAATVPGTVPGSFGVSETGAATYSIPIAVPPGTAGMEPKLSLNYSSQGGNGIAGVGWSLGGLSAITRCPQTIVQDGQTRGVQLDVNDRFCLDGQRLIVVNGSTYGAVGAQYRTEIESFSKVVSYGGAAGDPQYFKVWTKAGQIVEFGNTADARAEAQGKTVAAAWAVSKVSDTVGNYIAFTYFEDNANGEHRVTRIDYTGNAAASISPYNTVEFQYEARPDPSSGYLAGSRNQQTQRLSHILTRAGGALAMDYGLSYEIGTTTGRSRFASLTQCAANGDCLNPTTFGWQEGEVAAFNPVAVETPAPTGTASNTWFSIGDVNGDGRADAIIFDTSRNMHEYHGQDDGSFVAEQQFISAFVNGWDPSLLTPAEWRLTLQDVNGDGLEDAVMCGVSKQGIVGPNWSAFKEWDVLSWQGGSQGQGTRLGQTPTGRFLVLQGQNVYTWKQWCLDAQRGDGRAGVVKYQSTDDVYFGGSSFYHAAFIMAGMDATGWSDQSWSLAWEDQATTVPLGYTDISAVMTADITGDGISDVVRFDYGTGTLYTWSGFLSGTLSFFHSANISTLDSGGSPSSRWFRVADVNGDGLGDMVLHDPATGSIKVWLSMGNGLVASKTETSAFTASSSETPLNTWFFLMDVNGDGWTDTVKYHLGSGMISIALSNGDGTFHATPDMSIGAGPTPTATTGPNPTTSWFQPANVNGDGLPDWVRYDPTSGKIKVNLGQGAIPDLLLTITDGLGATRSIAYKPLTDPGVYTKGTGATYPVQDVQNATHVVVETAADDGIGGSFRNAYRYAGARIHLTGRGFLGFATLEQADLQTGIVTRTDYRQDFPTIGQPVLVTRTSSGGVELNRVENTYAVKAIPGGGQFPYLAYSKVQSKDLNGALMPLAETWSTYGDDWGNLTKTIIQTSDGFKKQTDNTYANDGTNWLIGRLTRAAVTSSVNNGGWTQARVSAFGYDPATGLLNKEILEPDQPQLRLDTAYAFDAFGNRKSVTVSSPATGAAAIATRTTTTTYDARGQFPVAVANALGHTESKTFDSRFGVVANLTGPNALATAWQYDSFGRKTRETRVDGTYTVWTYAACDAACPTWGVYRIVTQIYAADSTQAAPASVVYFDKLNRETRTATQGFDGRWIYKDTVYDNQGRAQQISRPYFAGQPAYWSTSEYDDLGRVVKVFEPDVPATAALSVVYNGLTISRTNRKNQTTTEVRNSQGQKVNVTDAMGNVTTYTYDPFGNPLSIANQEGVFESYTFHDIRGRKTWGYSPDMGWWTYEYDALGELTKQIDAKQQATTFTYDQLGRMTQRVEPGMTSDWKYDDAAYGKGKLYQAKTSLGYIRTHWYDDKGRPQLTQSNQGAGNPLFMSAVAYDSAGRVSEEYVLSGVPLKRVYNALGYQTETRNASSNALYWQLNQMDAEGHATQETYGNGTVVYTAYLPANGRFNYRVDNRNGFLVDAHTQGYDELGNVAGHFQLSGYASETYTYDALNRLTQMDGIIDNTPNTQTIAYDVYGNITSKTGVGAYYYGGNVNCPTGSNAGPHAVCKAGNNAYAYDPNGNLTGGGGRSLAWTAWNTPASLTQGGQTTTWLYGPERDRYKMTAPGRTTWYQNPSVHQGGHFELTHYASGTTEYRTTVYGGGRPIGEVLAINDGGTFTEQTRYFHSDAQGSITAVTDANGAVLTRYRYDPWGKQTLVSGSNTGISQTRQGHTGHEMLAGGLTHMNGRLYDPHIARFVSADPYVQEPYNLQSLNRYSYVWNNPLGYTDPTGYFRLFGKKWSDLRDNVVKPVAAIAVAWVVGPIAYNFGYWGAAGAVSAAGGSVAAGGFAGAVAGGALAGAATGAVAGGLYGGWNGAVQGARYGAIGGAIAGPVGEWYGNKPWGVERLAANSLAGGATSAAQGGSFAEGARNSFATGSAAWLYTSTVYADTMGKTANPMPGRGEGTYIPLDDGRIGAADIIRNVIGKNEALDLTGSAWHQFWTNLDKQGGFISSVVNYIPGINATGALHDTWWNPRNNNPSSMFGFGFNAATNWGTMLPAAAVTYGSLLDNGYAGQAVILDQIRR